MFGWFFLFHLKEFTQVRLPRWETLIDFCRSADYGR